MSWEISLALIPIALLFVMIMARGSQRKRMMAEHEKMLDSLRPGTEVNVGGIIGTIKKIKQDGQFRSILLQTGDDKNPSTLLVDARAIVGIFNPQQAVPDVQNHEQPDPRIKEVYDRLEAEERAEEGKKGKKK